MKIMFSMTLAGLLAAAMVTDAQAQVEKGSAEPLDGAGIARLMSETGGKARVSLHPATGAARFVRLEPARTAAAQVRPMAPSAQKQTADFLQRYGSIFGIRDAGSELQLVAETADRQGHRHVTYRQMYNGVPVFAGVLKGHVDARNRLLAVNGTFVPGLELSTTPTHTSEEAASRAVAKVGGDKPDASGVQARGSKLYFFREGLIQGVPGPNRLVWEVEVGNGVDVREFVYIDAHTGKWVDQITGIQDALDRRAYDGKNLNAVPPEYPGTPFWVETDPLPTTGTCVQGGGLPPCNQEADNMLYASEETYDLFSNAFGRDGFDGAGSFMDSIFDRGYGCPNASWNGVYISFCPGYTTDDVTAHEWGHAYTEYTHDLIYEWQAGALNESYSDIWGETVDLLNGRQTDSPGGLRSAAACSTFTTLPSLVTINSPAAIAGDKSTGYATFGAQSFDVTQDVVLVDDGTGTTSDGCQSPFVNAGAVAGKIALVDRGTCSFAIKAKNAQTNGAVAVIVANNTSGIVNMSGTDATITIPALSILQSDGVAIKAQLALPVTVNATMTGGQTGTDNSVRWLMGEDVIGGNAFRDMWNPTCNANPGKVSDSKYYVCSTSDGGGVHTNSGIPNHAYALLVDGGSYNGQAVVGIGLNKAAHIYFRAMSVYQNPGSDFAEHADALEQSCADLLGVEVADLSTGAPSGETISAFDCTQVAAAIAAVELRTPPTFCNFQPLLDPTPPDRCGAGTAQMDIFLESFAWRPLERPNPRWRWTASHEAAVPDDFTPREWTWLKADLPDGRSGFGMYAPDPSIGTCGPGGDESGVLRLTSPTIRVPAGVTPLLTFDHWVATETGWDGGNVEVSVNGGAWTLLAPGAFTFNSYNSSLATVGQGNTNPLAGQAAFTGADGGSVTGSWGRSHVDLGGYASGGNSIQLRWNLGTDGCGGRFGWYIDDVFVYACAPIPTVRSAPTSEDF